MSTNRSVEDLLEFLEHTDKIDRHTTTIAAMRSAVNRVLSPLPDAEKLDVAKINIHDAVERFARSSPNVASNTIAAYERRVRRARNHFFLTSGVPELQAIAAFRVDPTERPIGSRPLGNRPSNNGAARVPHQSLSYPFAVRKDCVVTIQNLPIDLTSDECDRLASFLRALVSD